MNSLDNKQLTYLFIILLTSNILLTGFIIFIYLKLRNKLGPPGPQGPQGVPGIPGIQSQSNTSSSK